MSASHFRKRFPLNVPLRTHSVLFTTAPAFPFSSPIPSHSFCSSPQSSPLLSLQHHLECFRCFYSPSCGHRHCIKSRCSVGGDTGWTSHCLQPNLNRRSLSAPETLLHLLHRLPRHSTAARHVWPGRGGGGGGWGHSRHIHCMDQLCSCGPIT